MFVEEQGADKVLRGNRPDEMSVSVKDNDPIVHPVANPDIAGHGINSRTMGVVEFPRAVLVAIPLVDKLGVLVEMDDARDTNIVGWVTRAYVIGAFVTMAFKDVDIAIGAEVDLHGLPQKP